MGRESDMSVMYEWLKFKHPVTCIIAGPSNSGKSTFCITFLQNLDTLCTEQRFKGGIILCYSEKTAVPHKQVSEIQKNVSIIKACPKVILKTRNVNRVSLF